MDLSEVEVTFEEMGDTPDGWLEGTRNFEATVGFEVGGKRWAEKFEYHQGPGITREPDAASLLSSLALDANLGDQTFADFCADLGYDEDSRKAFASWEACRASMEKLRAVFGSRFEEFVSTDWESIDA